MILLSSFSSFFIDRKTGEGGVYAPDKPEYSWELYPTDNGLTEVRVKWLPNFDHKKPGSHFFVKHRISGTSQWVETDPVIEDDFIYIRGLEPENTYEMVVVSVDGELNAESEPQEVPIPENGMQLKCE